MTVPTATKTFLLQAISSSAMVLLVNVLSASAGCGRVLILVADVLRYVLLGAGAFFLVVAASTWGVVLANAETARDALHHQ